MNTGDGGSGAEPLGPDVPRRAGLRTRTQAASRS